jgi:hypothetical protein
MAIILDKIANDHILKPGRQDAATAARSRPKGRDIMSVFNHTTRTRAIARGLFPATPEAAPPERHGRDAPAQVGRKIAGGRLKYRSTPFYLKIHGLEGPRQARYV